MLIIHWQLHVNKNAIYLRTHINRSRLLSRPSINAIALGPGNFSISMYRRYLRYRYYYKASDRVNRCFWIIFRVLESTCSPVFYQVKQIFVLNVINFELLLNLRFCDVYLYRLWRHVFFEVIHNMRIGLICFLELTIYVKVISPSILPQDKWTRALEIELNWMDSHVHCMFTLV